MLYTASMIYPPPLEGRFPTTVIFEAGDINAFKDDERLWVTCTNAPKRLSETCVGSDPDLLGKRMLVRRADLADISESSGPVLGWMEKRRLLAKAWFYRKVTGLLLKINEGWLVGTPDYRRYYWYVKDNSSVVRVSQRGAFRCDNWRPIADEQDLEEFHRDLRRLGFWSA